MRNIFIALLILLSFGLSCYVFAGSIMNLIKPSDEIVATFQGAAREDIFGVGFWLTWIVFSVLHSILLIPVRIMGDAINTKRVVAVATVAYLAASIALYFEFDRTEALWALETST